MKAQVISFRCILKTKLGRVISSTFNHDVLNIPLASGPQALPGLVEGLQNLKGGEKRRITVSAERAYGYYDPDKVITCDIDAFDGRHISVGESVQVAVQGQAKVFRVTSILDDEVTLDANHPLAGEDLIFEIEALDVREARPEELGEAFDLAAPGYH